MGCDNITTVYSLKLTISRILYLHFIRIQPTSLSLASHTHIKQQPSKPNLLSRNRPNKPYHQSTYISTNSQNKPPHTKHHGTNTTPIRTRTLHFLRPRRRRKPHPPLQTHPSKTNNKLLGNPHPNLKTHSTGPRTGKLFGIRQHHKFLCQFKRD